MRSDALIALTRFGFAPRAGEAKWIAGDPRGHVLSQLGDRDGGRIGGLKSLAEVFQVYQDGQVPFRMARASLGDGTTEMEEQRRAETRRNRNRLFRGLQEEEVAARFGRGVATDAPLVERLVLFWSNHFSVNKTRSVALRVLAGNFERAAIRPHVLGNFEDMLVAATLHPAMLGYLDNDRNIAPGSHAGQRRGVAAANENLARELLELHTLGAGSGYTQGDVQQVALILAGWTGGFNPNRPDVFEPRFHDESSRTVLGKSYPAVGAEQVELLLPDLANHPWTARHVAEKLSRHFVGDAAPATLVEALERSFQDTGGDLAELAATLVRHDGAWTPAAAKTVPPYDFTVGATRAIGATLEPKLIEQASRALAQDIWAPPSPAGWPDGDDAFLGGDSLLERIDFAGQLVRRHGAGLGDVGALAADLFGADLDPVVAQAIDRAEDRSQAAVLLLMSPPFQRR